MLLKHDERLVDRNVYWLSTQPDVVNWPQTIGNPQAVVSQYANLRALRALPQSSVSATAVTTGRDESRGANLVTTVTITNTASSTVAFLLRADARHSGTASGQELPGQNELQSSTWQNNDITLFPGESQTLTVSYGAADLQGATPVISLSGWNVPTIDVAAPVR